MVNGTFLSVVNRREQQTNSKEIPPSFSAGIQTEEALFRSTMWTKRPLMKKSSPHARAPAKATCLSSPEEMFGSLECGELRQARYVG